MSRSFEAPAHWKASATRRRDPAGTREALLQTEAELFLAKSDPRASLNDVAERLNVNKPALYHDSRTGRFCPIVTGWVQA